MAKLAEQVCCGLTDLSQLVTLTRTDTLFAGMQAERYDEMVRVRPWLASSPAAAHPRVPGLQRGALQTVFACSSMATL